MPYGARLLYNLPRRGARVDDWNGLENRRGVTAAAGSNPAPSASHRIVNPFDQPDSGSAWTHSGVSGLVPRSLPLNIEEAMRSA